MRIFRKLLTWFRDSSLNRKIMILVLAVGVIPIGVAFMVSLAEMEKTSQEQQTYTVNQGFTQVFQAVEDKLDRGRNISTLLAVDDITSRNLLLAGQTEQIAEQLSYFDNISSYINSMEMVFNPANIIFYIDAGYAVADHNAGRFRSMDAIVQTDWYARLRANNGNATWIKFREDMSDIPYIAVVREMWNPNNYHEALGVLALVFEQDYLEEMLVASTEGQILYLETADGTLLASNVPEEELPRVPLGERGLHDAGFSRTTVDGAEYLLCSRMMETTNVYLVSLVSESMMKQEAAAVGLRLQIIYLVISLVSLLAVIPLTRSITRRIQMLKEQMVRTQTGVRSDS